MPLYVVTLSGEILLKSERTRPRFLRRLIANISDAFKRNGIREYSISIDGARLIIKTGSDASGVLKRIFGIYRFGEVEEVVFADLKDLAEKISCMAKDMVVGKKFAVRVHRYGEHDFTSIDAAREIGALLKPYSAGVDLERPDVEVWVEIRRDRAYLYKTRIDGPGGLPIGVEGRVLVLFSGGFDSPVASWFIARRGVMVDFLHYIMGSPQSLYQAFRVAKLLAEKWLYGYRPRMYAVDLRNIIMMIKERVVRSYRQVVLRAIMYVIADKIAELYGYDALATGESLGQAASQTLANITAIERVLELKNTILRPLIGFDKEDIIDYSREIGTHDESSKVSEFCAIAPTLVVTRAKPDELRRELSKIPEESIDEAIRYLRIIDLLSTREEEVMPREDIEIDYIPDNAIIIDLRSLREYREWHYPGSIHISMVDSFEKYRGRPIIFYCKYGHISYLMAHKMRSEGYIAYSLKGGVEKARELANNRP